MASTGQLIVGDGRQNIDTDQDGNVLTNMDSSENKKRGRNESVGWTGYLGTAAVSTIAGLGIADTVAKATGHKRGVVEPMFKGAVNKAVDLRDSFTGNNTPHKSSNSNKKQTKSGTSNQMQDGVNNIHNETPRTTNYAAQPNENYPISQSEFKGIVSKITKISSSRIAKKTFLYNLS